MKKLWIFEALVLAFTLGCASNDGQIQQEGTASEQKGGFTEMSRLAESSTVLAEPSLAEPPFTNSSHSNSLVAPLEAVEVSLPAEVNDMVLDGILTVPSEGDNFPAVILVHGSGPHDKDETLLGNKPFKDIAHGLAERGVACYRYDKATYAYPGKFVYDTELTLYEETVNDAVAIAHMVQNLPQIDGWRVYVLGHSQGGYSIPLIAQELQATASSRASQSGAISDHASGEAGGISHAGAAVNAPNAPIAGYMIMAGNVRPLDELTLEQIIYLCDVDGVRTPEEQAYIDTIKVEVQKMKCPETIPDGEAVMGAYKAYWAFLADYDPLAEAQLIQAPVLVLQGERDYQVTMTDFDLWKDAFEANPLWQFASYPALNHLMMPGEGSPSNADYLIKGHVDSEVIQDIADWILAVE